MNAFAPRRITRETEWTTGAAPGRVFPLLCPVREYEWIESWRCRVLHSESGVAEKGCIFETDLPGHGGGETWVVSAYEKDRAIEFVRLTPGEKVVRLEIRLDGTRGGGTRLSWRKVFTGLSPEGNRVVAAMADAFGPETDAIARMLDHYLTTGTMLRLADP